MRRIPRIQRLRAVQQRMPAAPSPCSLLHTPCTTTATRRSFQTTRARADEASDKKKRREVLEALERDRQSLLKLQQQTSSATTEGKGEGQDEFLEEDPDPETVASIVIPPEFTFALPPEQAGLDYVPAKSAGELEVVGGLEGWWDQEGHWGAADQLYLFARRKVEDKAVKEVLLRQAVVECLAVLGKKGEEALGAHWGFDREGVLRAAGVEVVIGESGDVTLKGDVDALVAGLEMAEAVEDTEVEAQPKVEEKLSEGEQQKEAVQGQAVDVKLETAEPVEELPTEEELSERERLEHILLHPDEAREMLSSQNNDWMQVPLANPQLKFAIHKRLYQLTGNCIHDAALAPTKTVQHLLSHIVQPPKPKKLAEEIEQRDELLQAPNVKVYSRRVTPIDKDVWAGRWKVIEDELTKRALPITGTGKYGKHKEKWWIMGKT